MVTRLAVDTFTAHDKIYQTFSPPILHIVSSFPTCTAQLVSVTVSARVPHSWTRVRLRKREDLRSLCKARTPL